MQHFLPLGPIHMELACALPAPVDYCIYPDDDLKNPTIGEQLTDYDAAIQSKLKEPPSDGTPGSDPTPDLFDEGEIVEPLFPEAEALESNTYTPEELDEYLTAKVMLPRGGESA